MDIKTKSGDISDVSFVSWPEGSSLIGLGSPLSDDGWSSHVELRVVGVGKSKVSLLHWSDSSCSSIKEEPLSIVPWLGVMNSESVLVSTNMLVPEKGLSSAHSGSDLESSSIWELLFRPADGSLIDVPLLVLSIVAVVVDNVSVVGV